jgi:hypothetical protein
MAGHLESSSECEDAAWRCIERGSRGALFGDEFVRTVQDRAEESLVWQGLAIAWFFTLASPTPSASAAR